MDLFQLKMLLFQASKYFSTQPDDEIFLREIYFKLIWNIFLNENETFQANFFQLVVNPF